MNNKRTAKKAKQNSPKNKKQTYIYIAVCAVILLVAVLIVLAMTLIPRMKASSDLSELLNTIVASEDIQHIIISAPVASKDTVIPETKQVRINDIESVKKYSQVISITLADAKYSHNQSSMSGHWDMSVMFVFKNGERTTLYFVKSGENYTAVYYTGKADLERYYFDVSDRNADAFSQVCKELYSIIEEDD